MATPDDVKRYLAALEDERESAVLYRRMAAAEKDPKLAAVYRHLAETEEKHAGIFTQRLEAAGVTPPPFQPSFRTRLLGWIARHFGVEMILPSLAATEDGAASQYGQHDDMAAMAPLKANLEKGMQARKDKVVAQPISKDEQITTAMFKYATDVGLAPSTPKDHLAVSIPYEAVRGVAGLIKPGDYVAVVGTFEPGDGKVDTAITKIVLPKAQVLAVGKALSGAISTAAEKDVTPKSGAMLSNADTSADAAPTITLALTPVDVEKLVFAQEEGKVWLALFSPNDPSVPVTTGIRLQQEIK